MGESARAGMNNIMLDLEALDSARSAIIVSIGAVYFDLHTSKLGDEFYVEISTKGIKDQYEKGRTFSFETFNWWMAQSDSARNVFLKNGHEKKATIVALGQFITFCSKGVAPIKMWGNGVDYDNVVLRDVFETYNMTAPWKYGNNRCYRTVKNMFGDRAPLEREGAHHNGLDDAKTQARHLIAMMKGVYVNE